MYRICDDLIETSTELVRAFKRRNNDGIAKSYRSIQYFQAHVDEVGDELFVGQGESLQDWYHLGVLLGKSLRLEAHDYQRDAIPQVMTQFIDLGRKLLPENALDEVLRLYDPESRYIGTPKRDEPAGKLIMAILKLDKCIYQYLQKPVSAKHYLVFDDKNRTVTFFGIEISFDDFPAKAKGGLKVLRVLAQHPGEPLSASQLIEASDLAVEPNQLVAYISRLRQVLKKKIGENEDRWPIELRRESRKTKFCFILPNRTARKRAAGKDPVYELALPPDRVKYIAP
jgi:hypothetical protein